MSVQIELVKGRILVLLQTNEGLTPSGIQVAEPEALPKYRATVVKVGPEVTFVKPGDSIIIKRYAGEPVLLPGETKATLYIMNEADIEVKLEASTDAG